MVPSLPLEIIQQIIAATATSDHLIQRPTLLPLLALVHRTWTPFAQRIMRTTMHLDEPKETLLEKFPALPFSTQLTSLHVVSISVVDLGSLLSHTPNLNQLDASYKRDTPTDLLRRTRYDDSPSLPSPETAAPLLGGDVPHLRTLVLDASNLGHDHDPGRHFPTLATSLAPFSTLHHLSITGFSAILDSDLRAGEQAPLPPPATFALHLLKLKLSPRRSNRFASRSHFSPRSTSRPAPIPSVHSSFITRITRSSPLSPISTSPPATNAYAPSAMKRKPF